MPRKRYNAEEIIHKLREADVLLSQGRSVKQVSKQLGVAEQTYYRWRKAFGGMKVDQAKRLKDLQVENARLKRAVADLTVDKLILKEVTEGKYSARRDGGKPFSTSDNSDLPIQSPAHRGGVFLNCGVSAFGRKRTLSPP